VIPGFRSTYCEIIEIKKDHSRAHLIMKINLIYLLLTHIFTYSLKLLIILGEKI